MAPIKLCIRCNGTGKKFGGECYHCKGTGQEPRAKPQATTHLAAEDILFDDQSSSPPLAPPSGDLATLTGRLNAAIQQIGTNNVTAMTGQAKLVQSLEAVRTNLNEAFKAERQAHAQAIQALELKLQSLEDTIESQRPVQIVIKQGSDTTHSSTIEGHRHPQFRTLLRAASCRQSDGYRPNIWVAGPAGSGKTTGGRQLAKALSLPFFFNGAVSMEHKLIGFTDANGHYHETPFRNGYTVPAVYQFDDVDSSENSALLALNAALANGECDFADKLMPRHPDSIILATANTWGLGATSDYVGRVKIDAAFLSRFPIKLHWPYDEPFEVSISSNPDWAKRVQKARHAAQAAGLKVIIDPRHTIAGAALISNGFTPDEAANLTYLANIPQDKRHLLN